MLYEAGGVTKFIVVCGYTDLRKGIDGLSQLLEGKYQLNPLEKNVLFLFCGRRCDRIKGLLWEGNGFLLLYKRYEGGSICWPRSKDEAVLLTKGDYRLLLQGLNPLSRKTLDVPAETTL